MIVGQKAALSGELNTFDLRENSLLLPLLMLSFKMLDLHLGIPGLEDSKGAIPAPKFFWIQVPNIFWIQVPNLQ